MTTETFAAEFAEMAIQLHDEPTLVETVERVLDYALKAVNADYAGVVFLHGGGRVETAAATHPRVAELDQVQMECGEGPDVTVVEDRYQIVVNDTRYDQRWPLWAKRMADGGIYSLLSTRLATGDSTVGCVNLYTQRTDGFDEDDREVAFILARHAATALACARQADNVERAVDARKRIGQAQGILMERYDLTADQAFSVLLRYSQHNNVKLRVVADRLVDTRKLPS